MIPVTKKESNKLNSWIKKWVDDGEFNVSDTGKSLAYIGWYWRDIDFTEPFILGHCKSEGTIIPGVGVFESAADFIGFMENNKWGYKEIRVSKIFYEIFIDKIREIKFANERTDKLSLDSLREINDLIQSQRSQFEEEVSNV